MTPVQEKDIGCPRCGKDLINTFRIKQNGIYVDICKCRVCGFLFASDEDMLNAAQAKVKELFIKDIRRLGKAGTNNTNKEEGG